jgi:hypothetical protein
MIITNIKCSLIVLLLLVTSASAENVKWVKISDNTLTAIYVDSNSISSVTNNIVRARIKAIHKIQPPAYSGKPLSQTISYDEHDCKLNKTRGLEETSYYKDGTTETELDKEWLSAYPGTLGMEILLYVCETLSE